MRGRRERCAKRRSVLACGVVVVLSLLSGFACGLDVIASSPTTAIDAGADAVIAALPDGALRPDDDASPDSNSNSNCTPSPSFASDPRNCGRCGHDCFGGTCVQSTCTAWTVAANLDGPYGIASDGTSLFITLYQGNKIVSCPLAGCGPSGPSVIIGASGPSLIGVSGTQLVWAEYTTGNLDQCTLPNCAATRTNIGVGLSKPDPGAVHGGELFWPNFGAPNTVMRCTLPACTLPTIFTYASEPDGVAVNATTVFYSEFTTNRILACPRATGCVGVGLPREIASADVGFGPTGIALDAQRVYWANNKGDGGIVSCPLGGCTDAAAAAPLVIAGDERSAVGVVVDGERIYWTNWIAATGTVRAIAKP